MNLARSIRGGAETWEWGGLCARLKGGKPFELSRWPVEPDRSGWIAEVNRGLDEGALERVRTSVSRGRPFGGEGWVRQTAHRLGLTFTLRGPGRPAKQGENQ